MKKQFLFSAVLALLIFAFSCKQKNSMDYNDTVVNLYSLFSSRFSADLNDISGTADGATKQAAVARMEKLTDSCTNVLNGLKPVDEAKNFHNKLLELYGAAKTDLIPLCKKIAAIDKPDDNVDEYNKLIDEYNTVFTKFSTLETQAQTAQREFASKVNMQLR